MSEQKLVSPLLDGFVMGDPMSNHDGVCCCPAMRENSEEKYIVKIVSVPASQRQLDALLLTGAYPDAASATAYFKEVAEGVVKEAELLKQLSRLEGFLAYDNWQIVPMEGTNLGYQIYLISPYKRSLDKYLQRHQMTHLGAVNLGLDLCAALSICRRAGFLHMDLKPSNIFMNNKREFRILGDAGGNFLKIVRCGSRIGIGTGQQKCVQLLLGSRNRNDFDNILFFGVLSNGRAAADTVMTADGFAHDKAIQKRRDQFKLGQ